VYDEKTGEGDELKSGRRIRDKGVGEKGEEDGKEAAEETGRKKISYIIIVNVSSSLLYVQKNDFTHNMDL
jgi:hypothetical protein